MLFGKRKSQLPDLITDEELDLATGINYEIVLNWLVGLSDADYEKVVLTVPLYRQADAEAAKVLGKPNDPVTFIDPPQPADDDSPAFLEDAPKPVKKVPVK